MALALLLMLAVSGAAGVAQVATPQAPAPSDLAGVAALPLSGERLVTFEAYVESTLQQLGVPGASVAVVQDGQVVYEQGFGVTQLGGTEPVTPDTLMMIGSVTKSLTSTLAATLVDKGWLSWDTPVRQLLPSFAVADPSLTPQLTVADLFCACTGIPKRNPETLFNADALTPDRMIAQVAELPMTAPFGELFQYNNQLYIVGGYAVAAAAGAAPNNLDEGYTAAMRDQLLNPLGMTHSTFALEDVLSSGDYARPHNAGLDGQLMPASLVLEERFHPGPAGGMWSSASDMARYLQMELGNGVTPDGTQVVSAANLERTRAPRVAIPDRPGLPPLLLESAQHYGMGWFVGTYKGQPLINHSGGTLGFSSEAAFLPEAGLGVVILTNDARNGETFALAVQYRLFELLFNQPPEIDPLLTQLLTQMDEQTAQLQTQVRPVDPAAVAPYLGRYTNPALGELDLLLRDGQLIFDVGELRSELRAVVDESGSVIAYLFADPPLASAPAPVILQRGADGGPEVSVTVEGDTPEATETYVFTQVEASAAARSAAITEGDWEQEMAAAQR